MYGVEICEITNKSSCSSEEECLKYYASLLKISVGSDKILKEEISDLGGKKILNLTLSLTIESVGAVVLTSVIREYKGVLVRTFVFSWPEDSDNSKIDAFFRSIEYL